MYEQQVTRIHHRTRAPQKGTQHGGGALFLPWFIHLVRQYDLPSYGERAPWAHQELEVDYAFM